MSAAERASMRDGAGRIEIGACTLDIVEIAALRGRAREVADVAGRFGMQLPAMGRATFAADQSALCVRPDRWLLLTPAAAPGATASRWQAACEGVGAVVDLSSALTAWHLAGASTCNVLARACRLDLAAEAFPTGHAAATIMVQVSVILARHESGMLLLTPSTTARHLHEWLISTARPFGLTSRADLTPALLFGEKSS